MYYYIITLLHWANPKSHKNHEWVISSTLNSLPTSANFGMHFGGDSIPCALGNAFFRRRQWFYSCFSSSSFISKTEECLVSWLSGYFRKVYPISILYRPPALIVKNQITYLKCKSVAHVFCKPDRPWIVFLMFVLSLQKILHNVFPAR